MDRTVATKRALFRWVDRSKPCVICAQLCRPLHEHHGRPDIDILVIVTYSTGDLGGISGVIQGVSVTVYSRFFLGPWSLSQNQPQQWKNNRFQSLRDELNRPTSRCVEERKFGISACITLALVSRSINSRQDSARSSMSPHRDHLQDMPPQRHESIDGDQARTSMAASDQPTANRVTRDFQERTSEPIVC